jgi:hypothetical protein
MENRNRELKPNTASLVATARPPTGAEILFRAHEIFETRGGIPGRELEDWLLAEQELKHERTGTKKVLKRQFSRRHSPAWRDARSPGNEIA